MLPIRWNKFNEHFFFLVLNTSNNMQTSNVLVKTDNLINTFEQLFASDFVVCFFEDHIITEVMIQSPKSSILRRLFYEEFDHSNANSNEKNREKCMIKIPKIQTPIDFTGKAVFINELINKFFMSTYIIKKPNVNYWKSASLFEVCVFGKHCFINCVYTGILYLAYYIEIIKLIV